VLAGMLGHSLFNNKRAGWFAAAFFAADGLFLSYSRTGLLDGLLVCFVLWSMLAAVSARSWVGVLLSAILVGLATTIKWSGVMTVIPAAVAVLVLGRVRWPHVFLFAIVPVVHGLVWMWGLRITGQPYDIQSLGKLMIHLYRHHLDMTKHHNELASPWFSWIYMYHPIVVKLSSHGWVNRYASSLSNLVFVYAGIAGLAVLSVGVAAVSSWRKLAERVGDWYTAELGNGVLVTIVGWCAMLAPWTVARKGYVFHYHYMPSFAFLILMLAGFFAHVDRKKAIVAAVFVGLACAVAAFYAPVWAEIPISEKYAHWRLIWRLWRP
jgi:dolichyl-phosphate-mannose--protein O-mannosyl transferase